MTDIVTMQVVQNSLVSIANEMGIVLMRSAYSTLFNEIHDFSCAILDKNGLLVAEGQHLLQHLGSLEETTIQVLKYLEEEGLGIFPGDVIFSNHTYIGGTHLPEINAWAPYFYDDELMFIPAVRAHHMDVGGAMIGSTYMHATDMYQEGLLIPPVKVYDKGEFRKDLFKMIVSNSRNSRFLEGDLKAEIAACWVAQKRLTQLIEKYGKETIKDCVNMLTDYSERLIREAIREIQDGVYEADHYCDDDGVEGKPVKMHVKITKKDTDIVADFTGTDPQTKGPLNTPLAAVRSGVYSGIFFMTLTDVKSNTGCYRPIKIIVPEGCFLNPRPPAPTVMMNDVYQRIYDLIVYALAPARPEKAYAGSIGATGTTVMAGIHPEINEFFIMWFTCSLSAGWGAHYCKDGKNSTGQPTVGSAFRNMPIEILETKYPFRVLHYAMRQDSGGVGKFRGGVGGTFAVVPLHHDATLTQQLLSVRCPPYGLFGGKSGRSSQAIINPGKDDEQTLPPLISGLKIKEGQIYCQNLCGGGGWGNPFERDPELVLKDVICEFVSLKGAKEDYGVIIDPESMKIDYEATEKLRKESITR